MEPPNLPQYDFMFTISPLHRLQKAVETLKKVGKAQKKEGGYMTILVTPNAVQFQVINGRQIAAIYVMFYESDLSFIACDKNLRFGIDWSYFSDLVKNKASVNGLVEMFKIHGKNRLYCRIYDAKGKEKSYIVPLFHLGKPITLNLQSVLPFCTVTINSKHWRTGLLRYLQVLKEAREQTGEVAPSKGISFDLTRKGIKFFAGKPGDNSHSFTYQNEKNCNIRMYGDEEEEYKYRVNLPQFDEKALEKACKIDNVGSINLYYDTKVIMTLTFLKNFAKSRGVPPNRGRMILVYYPKAFKATAVTGQ